MDKKVIEVIESYKQSLRKNLVKSGDKVEDMNEEGMNGIIIDKGLEFFFEFEHDGTNAKNPEDGSSEPIITMTVSNIFGFPNLTPKQRVTIMERLAQCYGVMMVHLQGEFYILKVRSLFADDYNMIINACHGVSSIMNAHLIISEFFANKKKLG